jgi:hypothetical protein
MWYKAEQLLLPTGAMWYYLHASRPERKRQSYGTATISTFWDCVTLGDGTYTLSGNVANYQYTLCNIPEERRSHLHRGGSLRSRISKLLDIFWSSLFLSFVEASSSALCYTAWEERRRRE